MLKLLCQIKYMPIHHNEKLKYYQWGQQKKYYYTNKDTKIKSRMKAVRQARAIYASVYIKK